MSVLKYTLALAVALCGVGAGASYSTPADGVQGRGAAGARGRSGAPNTIPATSGQVKWLGRVVPNGNAMEFDWEGVSATVTVANATYLTVDISDECAGNGAQGGGSRWSVFMSPSDPLVGPSNHRIATFYSGPFQQTYVLFTNPGNGCEPPCSVAAPVTFTLTRLTESRLSGCTAAAGLAVTAFTTDGVFQTPPAAAARRLEFVGDSITAGDLNDATPSTLCANAAWNNDITLSSGALLCLPEALGGFGADCMYTAWGGITLGVPGTWGMTNLYPHAFSSTGPGAYGQWNFTSFPVDAVVVNLGTNDRPAAPALEWQAVYVEFVESVVKTLYASPATTVFLAYGPMTTEYQPFVTNVTATLQAAGYRAHTLDLTLTHPLTGCFGHPSAADNVEIAAKARPQIAAVMGW